MEVAKTIPYKDFKDKIRKVNKELERNRHVEVWNELKVIYSARKWEYGEESVQGNKKVQ